MSGTILDAPDYCFLINLYGNGVSFTEPVWYPCGQCMDIDEVDCRRKTSES